MKRASFLLMAIALASCNSVSLGGSGGDAGNPSDGGDAPAQGGQDGGGAGAAEAAMAQHPYASTGAACIDYPVSAYRVFPYDDPSIQYTNGVEAWPRCTRLCNTVMPVSGAYQRAPLDQALPAGPCDDEGASCSDGVLNGWCPPCATVGGPGNGYVCVCRGHNWHCSMGPNKGLSMCGMPTCLDPSLAITPNSSCYQTTWTDTQVCACGICRDLCDSDAQCASGRCNLNQVCRPSTDNCTGPDECPAPCRGLCEPVATDGGVTDAAIDPISCPGPNPAARTCLSTTSECIPSTCTCGGLGWPTSTWTCSADCRVLPLCNVDGGTTDTSVVD